MDESMQSLMDVGQTQQTLDDLLFFNQLNASQSAMPSATVGEQSMQSAMPSATMGEQSMQSAMSPAVSDAVMPPDEIPEASTDSGRSWSKDDTSQLLKDGTSVLKGITEGYLKQSEIQMQREMQKRKFLAEMMQKMQQAKAMAPMQAEASKTNMLDQMYAALQQTKGVY